MIAPATVGAEDNWVPDTVEGFREALDHLPSGRSSIVYTIVGAAVEVASDASCYELGKGARTGGGRVAIQISAIKVRCHLSGGRG